MKKIFIINAFILSLWGGINAQENIQINLKLSGIKDSTVVQLKQAYKYSHHRASEVATDTLKENKVTFNVVSQTPVLYQVNIDKHYGFIKFMASPGDTVNISADLIIKKDFGDAFFYSYENQIIEGSPSNEVYKEKVQPFENIWKKYESQIISYDSIVKEYYEAEDNDDAQKLEEIENNVDYQKYKEIYNEYTTSQDFVRDSIISSNKDSWWGPFLTLEFFYTLPEPDYMNTFSEDIRNSIYGKKLSGFLPVVQKGKTIPTFNITDEAGNKKDIYEFMNGKKYLLIDFWASWCGPCRKEIPNLKKIYDQFSEKGLEIVSISIDKNNSSWEKAVKEEALPWPNFIDGDQSIATKFRVRAIPEIYLIDSDGKLVSINMRGKELAKQIETLLNN